MSLCCIGGVCVPYSALLPLLVWSAKWIVEKLGLAQYIPHQWMNLLRTNGTGTGTMDSTSSKPLLDPTGSCCTAATSCVSNDSTSTTTTTTRNSHEAGSVRSIESLQEWKDLLLLLVDGTTGNVNATTAATPPPIALVVAKFTASWCRPCQAIQPAFAALAQAHAAEAVFCTVDVDDVDSVAAEYGVAILPTVLVVQRATSAGAAVVVERYTGSNEAQLQAFVQAHLGQ